MERLKAAILIFGTLGFVFFLAIESLSPEPMPFGHQASSQGQSGLALSLTHEEWQAVRPQHSSLNRWAKKMDAGLDAAQASAGMAVQKAKKRFQNFLNKIMESNDESVQLTLNTRDSKSTPQTERMKLKKRHQKKPKTKEKARQSKTALAQQPKGVEVKTQFSKSVMKRYDQVHRLLDHPEQKYLEKNRHRGEEDFYVRDHLMNQKELAELKDLDDDFLSEEFYQKN